MMHSSTISGTIPARRTASATASAPSSVALNPFKAPRNLPVGVRTAATMTDSRTADLDALDDAGAEERLQAAEDHGRRAHHFLRPLRARGFDQQHVVFQLDVGDALERRTDGGLPREGDLGVAER